MKLALIFAFIAVGIAVASAGLTCYTDEDKCAEDECCIKVGLLGICRKLKKEDESCAVHPLKSLIKKHVYKYECPCAEGLKCVARDGLVGKFRGTCEPDSSEIVEPETPEPETPEPETPEPEEPEPETPEPEEPEPEEPEPEEPEPEGE